MPTYEHECTQYGYKFEIFQKMSDDRLQKCPKCNGALRRLFGKGARMIFKGGEFYETDYGENVLWEI